MDHAKADLQWHASALRNRLMRAAERRRTRVSTLGGRLHALSPLATLSRGYAVAQGEDGKALTSVHRFTDEMPFKLLLRDGRVAARVTDIEEQS